MPNLSLGTGKAPINPPVGASLMGYPTKRENTGVGLDLMLRVLLFGEDVTP